MLYILDVSLSDEMKETLIKKFEDLVVANGGTVEKTDRWGVRKLQYPINYKTEGYYVLMNFESDPALPAELERQMRNDENVVRFMVTRK